MTVAAENADQQKYWNEPGGTVWTQWQEQMDIQLAPLGRAAIDAVALQPGERVLDVGCGCGATTLQLAERVGPGGSVVGLDISEPMIGRASQRAAEAGLSNVRFLVADGQVATVDDIGGPADAMVSRFGVMFFANPTAAFTNLAEMVKPGGRLSFVCWQAPFTNAWMSALGRELLTMFPDQPPPDPLAPGPFAFADPVRTRNILEGSGWSAVEVAPCIRSMKLFGTDDFDTAVDGSLLIGGASRLLLNASPKQRAEARTIAEQVMRTFWGEGGATVDAACWLVTATRSST